MDGKKVLIAGAIAVGVYIVARRVLGINFSGQSDSVVVGPPPAAPVASEQAPGSFSTLPKYDDPVPAAGYSSGQTDYAGGMSKGSQSAIPSYAANASSRPSTPSPAPGPTKGPATANTTIVQAKAAAKLIPLAGSAPPNYAPVGSGLQVNSPAPPPQALSARAAFGTPTAKIARVWR